MVIVRRRLQLVPVKVRDERVKAREAHLLRKDDGFGGRGVLSANRRCNASLRKAVPKKKEQDEKTRTLTATASEASTAVDAIAPRAPGTRDVGLRVVRHASGTAQRASAPPPPPPRAV